MTGVASDSAGTARAGFSVHDGHEMRHGSRAGRVENRFSAGSTGFAAAEDVPRKMVMRTVITKSAGIRFWKQSVDSTDEQVDRLIVEQQRCHGERRERLVSGV